MGYIKINQNGREEQLRVMAWHQNHKPYNSSNLKKKSFVVKHHYCHRCERNDYCTLAKHEFQTTELCSNYIQTEV